MSSSRISFAINVAIGAATVDDRVVCRRVGNCSTTMLESDGHSLMLVAVPAEPDADGGPLTMRPWTHTGFAQQLVFGPAR